MISVTYSMILNLTLFLFVSGFFIGVVNRLIKGILMLVIRGGVTDSHKRKSKTNTGRVISDFISVLLVGMIYMLASYTFADGVFAIFPLCVYLISIYFGNRCTRLLFSLNNICM